MPGAAPGIVRGDEVHAALLHEREVVEATNGARGVAETEGVEEPARHDLHVPGDTGHADPVVPERADGAGDVRAVIVLVDGIGVAVDRVDAMAVVGMSIAVVIDSIAVAVAGIRPD